MTDDLRELLTKVAAGEVDPAEAARLIDGEAIATSSWGGAPADETEETGEPDASATAVEAAVTAVEIRAEGVQLRVIADHGITGAVAEGPHTAELVGGVLRVRVPAADGLGFYFGRIKQGWIRPTRVDVRVRPDLPVSVDAIACDVQVSGLTGPLDLRASASSAKVRDQRGAFAAAVTTSKLDVEASLVAGDSTVRAELSSALVRLLPGSDVAVTASGEMSSAQVTGAGSTPKSQQGTGERQTGVVGLGAASLDVTGRGSALKVQLP